MLTEELTHHETISLCVRREAHLQLRAHLSVSTVSLVRMTDMTAGGSVSTDHVLTTSCKSDNTSSRNTTPACSGQKNSRINSHIKAAYILTSTTSVGFSPSRESLTTSVPLAGKRQDMTRLMASIHNNSYILVPECLHSGHYWR